MPQALLSAFSLLAAILLVLAGAYVFTRWAGRNLNGGLLTGRGGGRIQVLDRAVLGRDAGRADKGGGGELEPARSEAGAEKSAGVF